MRCHCFLHCSRWSCWLTATLLVLPGSRRTACRQRRRTAKAGSIRGGTQGDNAPPVRVGSRVGAGKGKTRSGECRLAVVAGAAPIISHIFIEDTAGDVTRIG